MEFEWDPEKARRNLRKHEDDLKPGDGDFRPEYDSSVLKDSVRSKYLDRDRSGRNLALLAPDVQAAFPTDESVNRALRSLIQGRTKAPRENKFDESTIVMQASRLHSLYRQAGRLHHNFDVVIGHDSEGYDIASVPTPPRVISRPGRWMSSLSGSSTAVA
ncbi:MAG: hypothetical protein ACLQIB_58105 [Isosphaeraceae bacterium]